MVRKSPNGAFATLAVLEPFAVASLNTSTLKPPKATHAPTTCALAYLDFSATALSAMANGIAALSNNVTLVIDVYLNAKVTK